LAAAREDARVRAADDAGTGGSDNSLPDVLARAERVREFAARSFGRVVAARAPAPAQAVGWHDGHRAASLADLGRGRLAGRRALTRGAP
jgi:hypothetical protein